MLGVRCTGDLIDQSDDTYTPAGTTTLDQALSTRSSGPQIPSTIEHDFTILGSQQPDPYEKSNMTAAINETYGTSYTEIAPTHEIVKFTPRDYDEVALLDEWELDHGVPYFDIPFGYEVVQIGERYIDPSVIDSLLTPQYASVPVGTPMPAVPYTVQWSIILLPVHSPATYTAFYRAGYTGDNPNWDYDIYPGRTYYITDSLGYVIEQYPPTSAPPTGGPSGTGTTSNPPIGPPSGPPVPPVDPDCTPECENYPCCLEPLTPCGETDCNPDIPCDPNSPDWPDCMDPHGPTGSDEPLDSRMPDYCECTYHIVYPGQPLVFQNLIYELAEGETCGDLMDQLVAENPNYINLSCVDSDWTPPPPPQNACGCPIPWDPQIPAGCVQMEDDAGRLDGEPVINTGVRIRDRRFGRSDVVFTDQDGCWQHTERYSNRMWMWNKFSNDNIKIRALRGLALWQTVNITKDYVDRFTNRFNNILLQYSSGAGDHNSRARRYWISALSITSLEVFRDQMNALNVGQPRPRLNVSLFSNQQFNQNGVPRLTGGAPMLQNITAPYSAALFLVHGIQTAVIANLTDNVVPDVIMNIHEDRNFDDIRDVFNHELGHAVHHEGLGTFNAPPFWSRYRVHISDRFLTGNGNYGMINSAGTDPELVAISEAYAEFVGDRVNNLRGDGNNWDNVNVAGNALDGDYIPWGLFIDLEDNNQDFIDDPWTANPGVNDLIRDFTDEELFLVLTGFALDNLTDLQARLIDIIEVNNGTEQQLTDLIETYDAFN